MTVETHSLATDCHHHVYDSRYPFASNSSIRPVDASIEDYRKLQEKLGLGRNVLIQPSTYGFDNRLLVDCLSRFGNLSRGVAVIHPDISSDELETLHAAGIRGARVNLVLPGGATNEMIEPLARRIAYLGWHLQLAATGVQIVKLQRVLMKLQIPVVYDHMGLLPPPKPIEHDGFQLIGEHLASGRAWVKLSGVCNLSISGPPDYEDYSMVASKMVELFPARVLWGSDWPHVHGSFKEKPDDMNLLRLLSKWCGDDDTFRKVLVDNPTEVYCF